MVTKIIDTTCIRKGLKKRLNVTQAHKLISKCAKKKKNDRVYKIKKKGDMSIVGIYKKSDFAKGVLKKLMEEGSVFQFRRGLYKKISKYW